MISGFNFMIHHNGKDIKYINEDNDISLSGEDYGEYILPKKKS